MVGGGVVGVRGMGGRGGVVEVRGRGGRGWGGRS